MLRSFALKAISQNPFRVWSLSGSTPQKKTQLLPKPLATKESRSSTLDRSRGSGQQDFPATQDAVMLGKDKLRANSLAIFFRCEVGFSAGNLNV